VLAEDGVVAVLAEELVLTAAGVHGVITRAAKDGVVAIAGRGPDNGLITIDGVVAVVAVQSVGASGAGDGGIAEAGGQRRVGGARAQPGVDPRSRPGIQAGDRDRVTAGEREDVHRVHAAVGDRLAGIVLNRRVVNVDGVGTSRGGGVVDGRNARDRAAGGESGE